ncbi:MAG: M48 family metallopeptidase [Rhodobacteraceae bacterium]|nr:M48 family metallopeptidase [Paracoccaceae bacterium]
MGEGGRADRASLRGRAIPAGSSRVHAAALHLSPDTAALVLDDGARLRECPRAALRVEPRLGAAARRIVLPDGTLFETDDHAAVESAFGRDGWSLVHAAERFRPRLVLVLLAIVGILWALWRYGLDLMAAAALALTPAAAIDAIDAGMRDTLDLTLAAPTSLPPAGRARAEAVFARLLAQLDPQTRAAHDFRLEFRALPGMGPNALALPGGTVILSDELVTMFPSDDVLAGVLAHEIGHVVAQHGLRQLYRSAGIAVLVALLAGDTVPIVEDIVLEGNVLLSLPFSRRSEAEADAFGVALAAKAGFAPAGLITFFDAIGARAGEGPSWLSTHPASQARSDAIRELIGGD